MGGRGGSSASAGRGSGIDRILAENSENDAHAIEEIVDYMATNYGVSMTGVRDLPVASVADAAKGIEDVLTEYPNLPGDMFNVSVTYSNRHFYAQCRTSVTGQTNIELNGTYFKDYDGMVSKYANDVSTQYHPQGTGTRQITTHEAGHVLESVITDRKYPMDSWLSRYDALSSESETKRIVESAASKVKSTSAGKGKSTKALRGEISRYADTKWNNHVAWGETLAEAVSDYAANGSNAKPLSVAIHDELKSELG